MADKPGLELFKIISKDFEIEEMLSEEQISAAVGQAFAWLIDHDISKMMNILYRADVDEHKLKALLASGDTLSPSQIIAKAYLDRQKQKVETRKKYNP